MTKKSIKIPEEVLKSVKIFCAEHNVTVQDFTEAALKMQLQQDSTKKETTENDPRDKNKC